MGVKLIPPGSFAFSGSTGEVFTGYVKTFNAQKKWGFITSEDIQGIFDKDIFVGQRELNHLPGYTPNAGDQLQFTVEIEESGGQPEAKNIALTNGGHSPGALNAPPPGARQAPY